MARSTTCHNFYLLGVVAASSCAAFYVEEEQMKKLIAVIAMTLAAQSGSVLAGDAAAGQAKSAMCAACHGADGVSAVPMYPNLKGQKEQYLVSAMKAYKAGQRQGGMAATMQGMAMGLSDADIDNLAAYYSSLK